MSWKKRSEARWPGALRIQEVSRGWSVGQIEGLGQHLGSGLEQGPLLALHCCLIPELVIFIGCSNCTPLRKKITVL